MTAAVPVCVWVGVWVGVLVGVGVTAAVPVCVWVGVWVGVAVNVVEGVCDGRIQPLWPDTICNEALTVCCGEVVPAALSQIQLLPVTGSTYLWLVNTGVIAVSYNGSVTSQEFRV